MKTKNRHDDERLVEDNEVAIGIGSVLTVVITGSVTAVADPCNATMKTEDGQALKVTPGQIVAVDGYSPAEQQYSQRRLGIDDNLCDEQRRLGWTGTDVEIAFRLLKKFVDEHRALPPGKRQEMCPHLGIDPDEDMDAHIAIQCARYLAYCAKGVTPLPEMRDFVAVVLDEQAGRVQ